MVIFNSYVSLPEGASQLKRIWEIPSLSQPVWAVFYVVVLRKNSWKISMGPWDPRMGVEESQAYLVGGLEHFLFSHIFGMSSSQLTFIFFRGVKKHQPDTAYGDASGPHIFSLAMDLRDTHSTVR